MDFKSPKQAKHRLIALYCMKVLWAIGQSRNKMLRFVLVQNNMDVMDSFEGKNYDGFRTFWG